MLEENDRTITTYLEREMRESYLDYAMSVIVGRALPDARDGMKPVHRRVLYAMRQAGNDYNKPYKKSARIVGDVLGKFHPHGQEAVYDTIVRMAQPFSLRYMLVDGQGNFGSVDGDAPAAMRYTEIRLAKIAHCIMADIEKETVDMMPNYDGSEQEPKVLCPNFPVLVVNGASGIAVGMATNIPPHNLGNAIDACQLLLDNPDTSISDVIRKIKAPDFPTAGIIHGMRGVREAYKTGRGRVIIRARASIEKVDGGKKNAIIVTELPYMVNKAVLVEKIADAVRAKRIEGISDLRDESDRSGMRVVIEVKRDANPEVLLNNLYKSTAMQSNFAVNMVALVHGIPRTLDIREMLLRFLEHRREVVYRRVLFDLERAREKAHILEGFAVAVSNVEEIIATIKNSKSPAEAKATLLARSWKCDTVVKMLAALKDPSLARLAKEPGDWGLQKPARKGASPTYRLSARQAQSILEMRLQRLTAIERDKVVSDYKETVAKIVNFLAILDDTSRVTQIISDELAEVKKSFGDKRRTEIDEYGEEIDDEDLIEKEDMVVTLSHSGYIKTTRLSEFRTQKRGGTGKTGAGLKEEDFIADLKVANSHSTVLFFTSRGRLYWQKVYRLPSSSRVSRGKPIVNLLQLMDGERVQAMLAIDDLNVDDVHVVMATRNGIVKKTPLKAYSNPRSKGIIAISIDDGDELIDAQLGRAQDTVMLFTDGGMAVRFAAEKLRPIGRSARGVRGIKIKEGHRCVSMAVCPDEKAEVLTITEKGKGKRTAVSEYGIKGRGIQGVTNISKDPATGKVVCCLLVNPQDQLMLITASGRMIRIRASTVRRSGRSTKGVKAIDIGNDKLVDAARIEGNGQKELNLSDDDA